MRYRRMGRTDLEVSVISQGCWSLVGDRTWGPQNETDSIKAVHTSLDAGVNFFDTAEGYGKGRSEELLGEVIESHRGDVVIATKVSRRNLAPEVLKDACERSLKRLRTDYIDLYQLHWPNPDIPIRETFGAMRELVDEGKVRVIGVSNFGVGYIGEALEVARFESNQLPYSLLWRAIEHEILPMCVENDISILTYSSLFQGLLSGKYTSPDDVPPGRARTRVYSPGRGDARHGQQGCEKEAFEAVARIRKICDSLGQSMSAVALGWLLAQPGVTSVIVGGRSEQQARENASAGDLDLSPETIRQLTEITSPVKQYVGSNADMWESVSRMERRKDVQ